MYKYELHSHTSECDRDADLSARELVHLYREAGYDGMVITDHYIERFYTLWFPEEVQGLTHEQQVTRWLRGFRTAQEEGEKIGFTVLPGAEVRFDHYPNDYLLYGLHEEFFYTVPRLNELKSVDAFSDAGKCVRCACTSVPRRNGRGNSARPVRHRGIQWRHREISQRDGAPVCRSLRPFDDLRLRHT